MTHFYQGSLQEGIAAAVRDTKPVTCFVRDDEDLSTTWERDYFGDEEVAKALNAKAVVLRLTAGSQEAGFLASFCPVSQFPTVILIKNGSLKEHIGPDTSNDDFRNRLIAALDYEIPPNSTSHSHSQENGTPVSSATSTEPVPTPKSQPKVEPKVSNPAQSTQQRDSQDSKNPNIAKAPRKGTSSPGVSGPTSQSRNEFKEASKDKGKAPVGAAKPNIKITGKTATQSAVPEPKLAAPRGPPTQYRLQVRLFDGRSVRSSFTPTQSIKSDIRPWLDQQMEDDNRPYNLKHILNPLPSETLSVTQESQKLQDLGIGTTANLVMVPVSTYTEAYSAAGSLPVRGISAVYNLATSAATTATGLVGSFLGYGSTEPATESSPAPGTTSTTQRPRSSGPNIRTLRDQQDSRGDSQLYNGNQLNFEPRKPQDKDK